MSKVIVFAMPVFLLLIAIEWVWGRVRAGREVYRFNDAINSLSLGVISQLAGVLTRLLTIGIYSAVFGAIAIFPKLDFWNNWYGWVFALLFYDFCYYWLHRAGHEVALFWAAHVVHHQSQEYNLSTALRQTSSGALFGWIFYLPMAIAGVPPLLFGIVAMIDLLYQFWVHTELIGRLGWFDRVFCSPSNHRVHHAVNDRYLDRNYGGMLVIWDRMFGSFQPEIESDRCVYGTRSPLESWDPLWANAEVYCALARNSWRTRNWADKLRVWFKAPGWQPADLALSDPKPAFTLASVRRYDTALSRASCWFIGVQFALILAAVSQFLWAADSMPAGQSAIWVVSISSALWAIGLFMQGRLAMLELLLLETALLATLAALGWIAFPMALKPMPMSIACVFVVQRAISSQGLGKFDLLLGAALLASLAGDVLLMLPGDHFIAGLAAFLVAHLFYIALFRQQAPWFPDRRALAASMGFGALMYAALWSSLADPVLKLAVGCYIGVISLMVAQAIGRARVIGDAASRWVAIGACLFMLSDSLIAIDRFLTPLPMASLWILSSYFAAQMLIVHHSRTMSAGAGINPR